MIHPPRDTNRDQAVQRRASDLMDAGLALLPALLQAQRELWSSFMITVQWLPDCVRLVQRDAPERSIDIPKDELGPLVAQIVAEVTGKPDTFWDILAWLDAHAQTRMVGEHHAP